MTPILAVDPGSKHTGIVLRAGEDLLGWRLVVRTDTARLPSGDYLHDILVACRQVLQQGQVEPAHRQSYVVGVEGVEWWPRQGQPRNERGNYGTCMVVGAVLARWPDAIVVDPGRGVGNYHPQAYPDDIRPAVNGRGKDKRQHVRAAWDHSFATETLHLQREREAQPR